METFADKPAIVIDIGHAYTKCGFAGESAPTVIMPSLAKMSAFHSCSTDTSSTSTRSIYEYGGDVDCLRQMLVEFLYRVYYKKLSANSRERRVVVVESVLCSSEWRNTLASVLFKSFKCVSLSFLTAHTASLYTLGISTALVLDAGYVDATVMAIGHGAHMLAACDYSDVGGARRLHAEIRRMLERHALVRTNGDDSRLVPLARCRTPTAAATVVSIDERHIEDIKVRCCFVTSMERSRAIYHQLRALTGTESGVVPLDAVSDDDWRRLASSSGDLKLAPDCEYALNDEQTLVIPGHVRELALDVMFVGGRDSSVHGLLVDALCGAPLDLRRQLIDNIVLIGGTCMLAGFKQRLLDEFKLAIRDTPQLANLEKQSEEEEKKKDPEQKKKHIRVHVPPSHENCTAWLGASIYATLDTLDAYSLSGGSFADMAEKLTDCFAIPPSRGGGGDQQPATTLTTS